MNYLFGCFLGLLILVSCGLKFTPPETFESSTISRKQAVEQYIRDAYKDSSVHYQSIVFAEPTVIKPYQFRQLDSLYEIKYTNEQRGIFDRELEKKINNQKAVVSNVKERIQYIENHIYSIQNTEKATVYTAEIKFDAQQKIADFTIKEQHEIASKHLAVYKSFITGESLLYPNYQATKEEMAFYTQLENRWNQLPGFEQDKFLNNFLNVFLTVRNTRSLETKSILQHLSVQASDQRNYSAQTDLFRSVEGIWEGDKIVAYEQVFTTNSGTYKTIFSPYFELLSLEKIN
jgi:hypothetical protein